MGPFAGERLAAFVCRSALESLPEGVRHEAKRSVLNFVGAALGVCRDPAVDAAVRVLAPSPATGPAGLLGRPERLDPMSAAFVNAVAGNLLDYDDTHLRTVIHPSAPVVPAALAVAELRGRTGAEALLAFALGAEVECRMGNAVSPEHYARGWHITATCGVFGAAAAAAKLLDLGPGRTWHALGIAASQSAGLVENLSHGAKNVGVGNAARNGVLAALLAEQGYTAAPAAIEGPLGWACAAGDGARLDVLVEGLGERWELADNTYKPYPCGIVMHAVVDACLELRDAHRVAPDDVEAVVVRGDALLLARGDRAVHDERDARVSIHHCAAAALGWGAAGVDEFSAERVADPAAVALRARVRAELDPGLPVGAATVAVRTRDGAEHAVTVHHARGSRENPLADADIEAKVRDLVARGGSGCDAGAVIGAAWGLDALPAAADLVRAASVPAAA